MSEMQLGLKQLVNDDEDFTEELLDKKKVPFFRQKKWILTILVILIIALGGGGAVYAQQIAKNQVTYTYAQASMNNITSTVSATGPIKPAAEYDLSFGASGQISSINVTVGQKVSSGQALATLDSTSLQDSLAGAQQSVNNAQTSYNNAITSRNNTDTQANDAIQIAKDNYNTCTSQANANAQNCQDTENQAIAQQNSSIASAQSQVNSAYQSLQAAEISLKTSRDNLANATLTAPANATVAAINGQAGENVGQGSSGNSSASSSSQALIILVDTSNLQIASTVNESDIAKVQLNQPVQFTVSSYPNQTFRASVTTIDPVGQTSSSVVSYAVTMTVDQNSLNGAVLFTGMTATASITTSERINTLTVPGAALTFSRTALLNKEISTTALRSAEANNSSSTSGTSGVVVEMQNGKLVPVAVTTGLTDGTNTEILSGLNEGDSVIVSQTGGTTSTATNSSTTRGGNGGGFGGGGGAFFRGG